MTTALYGNEKLTVSLQFNLWVRIICEGNDNKTHMSFSKKPSKVTEDFRKNKFLSQMKLERTE